jgi:hypothetical protein
MAQNQSDSPFVYSETKFHPVSFLGYQKKIGFNEKLQKTEAYSPTLIDCFELSLKPDLSKNSILKGNVIDEKKGLTLLDQSIISRFNGVLAELLKKKVSSMFSFSKDPPTMPVRVFEPQSSLQRIAQNWCFAPTFLDKAAQIDGLERMKFVLSFIVASSYTGTSQLKPFNPLLGETFEGDLEDGAKIYCEHISNHPIISRFYIKANKYKLHGFYEIDTETKSLGSIIVVSQKGVTTIKFNKEESCIYYIMPRMNLENCLSDKERLSHMKGKLIVVDQKSELQAIIRFGKIKNNINQFEGVIISQKFDKDYKFNTSAEKKTSKKILRNLKNYTVMSYISGNWLNNLEFDKVEYWNIDKHIPSWVKPSMNVIPSDSRFREDLIWLFRCWREKDDSQKKKYEEYSQSWKGLLEKIQRNDRELRKKYKK